MSGDAEGPGEFAVRLRGLRERAALTQEELAERSGLTAKGIGALERGERRRPQPHTVRVLADALGLDDGDRASLASARRPAVAHPLPAPPSPLIGRDADRAQLVALLGERSTRLVTLTGPGGVGKTSLALDVARAADFPSVTVVELAPVGGAGLVLPTIARALGARQPDLDALAAFLGQRRQLVVLDNLEHLLDAAGDIADVLARCPGLVALATSRAALRIRAERERPLDPLPVPARSDAATVAASPAVQVFLDRASAAGRPVPLTDATAPDVAAICRRLDGLPLALELAAAHARFLSPAALLTRLDDAVGSHGARDLPPRQRTMRATLDWSHDLLTRDEQVLLRRLSVFAGGFTLAAAERVSGGDVLGPLGGLVEQSLVLAAGDRYRMLEPVRQYAGHRLADSGDDVAGRAAAFFLGLASSARAGLRTSAQAEWLDALQREHGNLGATLGRLIDEGRSYDAARLGADLWLYWALRGNAAEGLGQLAQVDAPDAVAQADLSTAVAGLRYAVGDLTGMAPAAASAVAAARDAEDAVRLVDALLLSTGAAIFLGEFDRADAELNELERRSIDLPWALAHAAINRGQLLLRTGDVGGGLQALVGAEERARKLGSPFTLATVLNVQASALQAAGDHDAALAKHVEAAELSVEVGTTWTLVYAVLGLAVAAARRGLPETAAELFAAGSATEESSSVAVSFPPDLAEVQRWLPAVRTALGEEAFRRAWERGRGLRPDDVPRLAAVITRAPG